MDATLELLDVLTKTLVPPIRPKNEKAYKQVLYPHYAFNLGDFYTDSDSKDLFIFVLVETVSVWYNKIHRVIASNKKGGINFPKGLVSVFGSDDSVIAVQVLKYFSHFFPMW